MTYSEFENTMLSDTAFPVNVNRRLSSRVVEYTVREWEEPAGHLTLVAAEREIAQRVKRRIRDSMNPFLLVILMAALSAIVQKIVARIIDWWLEQPEVRGQLLWKFRRELEGNGGWSSGDH